MVVVVQQSIVLLTVECGDAATDGGRFQTGNMKKLKSGKVPPPSAPTFSLSSLNALPLQTLKLLVCKALDEREPLSSAVLIEDLLQEEGSKKIKKERIRCFFLPSLPSGGEAQLARTVCSESAPSSAVSAKRARVAVSAYHLGQLLQLTPQACASRLQKWIRRWQRLLGQHPLTCCVWPLCFFMLKFERDQPPPPSC